MFKYQHGVLSYRTHNKKMQGSMFNKQIVVQNTIEKYQERQVIEERDTLGRLIETKKQKTNLYQEDTKFTWECYDKEREEYLKRVLKY